MLRDAYGNTYTYGHLAKLATNVLVAKERPPAKVVRAAAAAGAQAARRSRWRRSRRRTATPCPARRRAPARTAARSRAAPSQSFIGPPTPSPDELAAAVSQTAHKERLFANPGRSRSLSSGGRRQILDATFALPASASLRSYFAGDVGLQRNELELKRMIAGRRVIAGTILGRVGPTSTNTTSDMSFAIRPPGKGAPRSTPSRSSRAGGCSSRRRSSAPTAPGRWRAARSARSCS